MFYLLKSGYVTPIVLGLRVGCGRGFHSSQRRVFSVGSSLFSSNHPNLRLSTRRLLKSLEGRFRVDRLLKQNSSGRNSSFSHLKLLFAFPFVPAVFSSSVYDSKFSWALQRPSTSAIEIKSYSTRGSIVKYLYKTWDVIRFLLRLAKFAFLYSPFLFTYPVCYLSTRAEDLWWVLFKKAIVFGGPVTVEFAKWLGTREDLFLNKTCLNLASVSHRDQPHSWYSTKKKLRRAFGKDWNNTVVQFDPKRTEIHNSELAQVYKAKIPLDACSDQVAEEIVKDIDDFEGLEEPFLSDGIEIVGLGAWMSGHDEDDIVDDAFGSWMLTGQGLAQSKASTEEDAGIRTCPIVLAPPPPPLLDDASESSDSSSFEEKPKLFRERVRDRFHEVQLSTAERIVHILERGVDRCNNFFARSYALMAKVGTMRQELQIVPDPFDLTPAIPPKPVAEAVSSEEVRDNLYFEELLPEEELISPIENVAEDEEAEVGLLSDRFTTEGVNSASSSELISFAQDFNRNANSENVYKVTENFGAVGVDADPTEKPVDLSEARDRNSAGENPESQSGSVDKAIPPEEAHVDLVLEPVTETIDDKSESSESGVSSGSKFDPSSESLESTDSEFSPDYDSGSASESAGDEGGDSSPAPIQNIIPEAILEKVEELDLVAQQEIREKIPELTPEEVAIDEFVEGAKEPQPHIPESISEGVEALFFFGAEAAKSVREGVKEGVAQVKESVSSLSEAETDPEFVELEPCVLLQHHPAECICRHCLGLVPVAIKVLHPGIVRKSIRDLEVLHLLASFVQTFVPWMSWWKPAICVEEFADRLHRMINLKREALSLERFNINFAADPHVRFPRPMRPFVKRDVMVEMWEESENIQHFLMTEQGGEDRSLMPYSLRSALAEIISDALVKMIFTDNYVHCDINERNVLVQNGKYFIENPPDKDRLIQVEVMDTIVIAHEENKNPLRLVFCDADVASHISHPKAFADIFEGLFKREGCISAAACDPFIAESSRSKDLTQFREELLHCFRRHFTSRDGKSPDLTLLVEDIYRVLYYNHVKMEDDFVAVLTSMLAVETIGKKLIGKNQNLFNAIEKHFAMQSADKELI